MKPVVEFGGRLFAISIFSTSKLRRKLLKLIQIEGIAPMIADKFGLSLSNKHLRLYCKPPMS